MARQSVSNVLGVSSQAQGARGVRQSVQISQFREMRGGSNGSVPSGANPQINGVQ
jgi:hypothetical protein